MGSDAIKSECVVSSWVELGESVPSWGCSHLFACVYWQEEKAMCGCSLESGLTEGEEQAEKEERQERSK